MLRIDMQKLWTLIQTDPEIKKELNRILIEEEEKRQKAYEILIEQEKNISVLVQKKNEEIKKQRYLEDQINKIHNEISLLEIRRAFLDFRINKLKRKLTKKNLTPDEEAAIILEIREIEEKKQNIEKTQEEKGYAIKDLEKQKNKCLEKERDFAKEIDFETDKLRIKKKNVLEWDNSIANKKTSFYQEVFEKVNDDFKFLQDIVVRDLEKSKRLNKDEAKGKADSILIGQDKIAIDPPGKTRRLTKEEKEQYRNIA